MRRKKGSKKGTKITLLRHTNPFSTIMGTSISSTTLRSCSRRQVETILQARSLRSLSPNRRTRWALSSYLSRELWVLDRLLHKPPDQWKFLGSEVLGPPSWSSREP